MILFQHSKKSTENAMRMENVHSFSLYVTLRKYLIYLFEAFSFFLVQIATIEHLDGVNSHEQIPCNICSKTLVEYVYVRK